jgi:hypothetical protein
MRRRLPAILGCGSIAFASFPSGEELARAQGQTITVRPRSHLDIVNFGNPDRAYDSSAEYSAGGGYIQHLCSNSCTEPSKTISATFSDIGDGHRPLRLEVFWQVRPIFSMWPGEKGEVTAQLEYDLGNGWQPWEGEAFAWTQSSTDHSCPAAAVSSNGPVTCWSHNASRTLQPTQPTGVIKVRATAIARVTQCSNCTNSSQVSVTLNVSDVRVIAEAPTSPHPGRPIL